MPKSSDYAAGQLVVVHSPEVGDEYLARVFRPILPGTHAENPVVEILRILRYPIQRAILDADIPSENRPLAAGTLCRMAVARAPCAEDLRFSSWEDSFATALAAAMDAAGSDAERKILRRHAAGTFRGRRAILIYQRWQLWQP